jgi:hypothetical protein
MRMSNQEFWATTPRTLKALLDVHIEVNRTDTAPSRYQQPRQGYIDEIF